MILNKILADPNYLFIYFLADPIKKKEVHDQVGHISEMPQSLINRKPIL